MPVGTTWEIWELFALRNSLPSTNNTISQEAAQLAEFFEDPLTYWEMVTGYLDTSNTHRSHEEMQRTDPQGSSDRNMPYPEPFSRIKPHPWTSIASMQQSMFTRITRLIKEVRSFDQSSSYSRSLLAQPLQFSKALDDLEEDLWNIRPPSLSEIANTEDENTPAIHHLLLAEAYMFANFFQLYDVFPNIRRKRVQLMMENPHASSSERRSWAQDQSILWAHLLKRS